MKLARLIIRALRDMDILEEYYLEQYTSTKSYLRNEYRKNRYGLAIYKFLCGRLHDEENPHCLDKDEQRFIADEIEIIGDKGDKTNIQYKLKNPEKYAKYELDPFIAERRVYSLFEQPEILNDSIIIMLLIRYESIISELYKQLLNAFPSAYLNDKSIKYSELISLDSDINVIKKAFVEAEIDEFMRRPLTEWYGVFEQKHKLHFEFGEEFEQFKEIYYRRNVIVHNQGKSNKSYLSSVSEKYQCNADVYLNPSLEYLQDAFDCTRIVLVETFLGMIKLVDDNMDIIKRLSDIGYDYMQEERWKVSKHIFSALMRLKEQCEADVWVNKVNYYVSCKNLDGIASIRQEVENMDTTLMIPRLAIAKPALLDDYGAVSSSLEMLIGNGISVNEIKTWPLLAQFRESSEYKAFVDKHKGIFDIENCSTGEIKCLSEG